MSRPRLLAAASGVLLVFSHPFAVPGFDLLADAPNGLLAWIALVPGWLAIRDASPGEAFRRGWILASVHFLGALFWIVVALHQYGQLPLAVSIGLLLLLAPFLGVWYGLAAWAARRAGPAGGLAAAIAFPFAWTAAELLRSTLFTGFPWGHVGWTQWRFPWVLQAADLGGAHLIALVLVGANVAIAEAVADRGRRAAGAGTVAALLGATLAYGAVRLATLPASTGPLVEVALVQANVAQNDKHDRAADEAVMARYRAALADAEASGADLVVWPEGAIPRGVHLRAQQLPPRVLDAPNRGWLLTGAATWWDEGNRRHAYNSALLVGPGGRIDARYHKTHLVPFGEYVPLPRLLFFVRTLVRDRLDFRPGPGPDPLVWRTGAREVSLGVLICYEDVFPGIARAAVARGADLLVGITNDAWYGTTSAAYQHLVPAVFRAVETRRPVVRAAQTGISAVIAPDGRVVARTALGEGPVVLRHAVRTGGPATLHGRFGDAVGFLALAVSVALAAAPRRRG